MRKHFIRALLPILFIIISIHYCAAETFSVRDAVEIALRQNPRILAARHEISAAEANAKGARALANPEITLAPSIAGEGGSDTELLVAQPLEINGQRKIRARIASSETNAVRASARAVEREVVRDVKQAYWSVVLADRVLELSRDNLQTAQSLLEAASRQRDVGSAPGSQVVKAEVELARAKLELASAESELAKAKAVLNTLLGRSADTEAVPSDALKANPITTDAAELRRKALENRPEIAGAGAVLEARRHEIQAAGARRWPDLSVQFRQEKLGGEGGVGVGVSLPLMDWGSVRQEKKRAEAAAMAQEKHLQAVYTTVKLDLETALQDLARYETRVREYEGGLLSRSERLAELAQKGYKAGATGYLELLEARRTLRLVQTEYCTALADYAKAMAQLEWAVGTDTALSPGEGTIK